MVSVISRGAFSAKSDAEKVKFLQANPDVKVLTPQGLVNPIVNATGNQNDWQEASLVTAGGTTTVFGGAASELRLNPKALLASEESIKPDLKTQEERAAEIATARLKVSGTVLTNQPSDELKASLFGKVTLDKKTGLIQTTSQEQPSGFKAREFQINNIKRDAFNIEQQPIKIPSLTNQQLQKPLRELGLGIEASKTIAEQKVLNRQAKEDLSKIKEFKEDVISNDLVENKEEVLTSVDQAINELNAGIKAGEENVKTLTKTKKSIGLTQREGILLPGVTVGATITGSIGELYGSSFGLGAIQSLESFGRAFTIGLLEKPEMDAFNVDLDPSHKKGGYTPTFKEINYENIIGKVDQLYSYDKDVKAGRLFFEAADIVSAGVSVAEGLETAYNLRHLKLTKPKTVIQKIGDQIYETISKIDISDAYSYRNINTFDLTTRSVAKVVGQEVVEGVIKSDILQIGGTALEKTRAFANYPFQIKALAGKTTKIIGEIKPFISLGSAASQGGFDVFSAVDDIISLPLGVETRSLVKGQTLTFVKEGDTVIGGAVDTFEGIAANIKLDKSIPAGRFDITNFGNNLFTSGGLLSGGQDITVKASNLIDDFVLKGITGKNVRAAALNQLDDVAKIITSTKGVSVADVLGGDKAIAVIKGGDTVAAVIDSPLLKSYTKAQVKLFAGSSNAAIKVKDFVAPALKDLAKSTVKQSIIGEAAVLKAVYDPRLYDSFSNQLLLLEQVKAKTTKTKGGFDYLTNVQGEGLTAKVKRKPALGIKTTTKTKTLLETLTKTLSKTKTKTLTKTKTKTRTLDVLTSLLSPIINVKAKGQLKIITGLRTKTIGKTRALSKGLLQFRTKTVSLSALRTLSGTPTPSPTPTGGLFDFPGFPPFGALPPLPKDNGLSFLTGGKATKKKKVKGEFAPSLENIFKQRKGKQPKSLFGKYTGFEDRVIKI